MEQSYRRPQLHRPLRQHLKRGFRVLFGVAVMAVAAWVLVWLFGREDQIRFRGIVDSGAENVGPVVAARIVSVEVTPGQRVKAGDVLVRFDPAESLLEESLNEVKLREYEQGLARARANLQAEARRCRQVLREASVALEERRMERLREQAEFEALTAEIARLRPLVEKKLVSELELTALRPKADALRKTVEGYEPLLAALSNRVAQAADDLSAVTVELEKGMSSKDADQALHDALCRNEALRRADPSVLKALSNGVVSQVFRQSGDIVPAGEAVVRLASPPDDRFVTGMLPAAYLDAVHVGDELVVGRAVLPGRDGTPFTARGRVETIDPEVLDFFDPMNTAPRMPVRGRKVRIRLLGDASAFIPGETVVISRTGEGDGTAWLLSFFSSWGSRQGGGV